MGKDSERERILSNREGERVFLEQPPEVLQAICLGLGGEQYPALYISRELMVLAQNRASKQLFVDALFYSVESFLSLETRHLIRQCIEERVEQEHLVFVEGKQWNLRIVPVESGGAVLVFAAAQHQAVGVTAATADLRDRAANLILQANRLDHLRQPDIAAEIRREAYRILRSIGHLELLSGAPEEMMWSSQRLSAFIEETRRQLERQHVDNVTVDMPQRDAEMEADARLLRSALMSLLSNSLRHGGEQVHVCLSAEVADNSVKFRIDDDGVGISDAAMQRMNSTWELQDALPGGWGLGIPYVRRIAMMHRGLLVYVRTAEAGTHARLRMPLRREDPEILKSSDIYRRVLSNSISEADIELSVVLDAPHFRRD